MIHFSLHCDKAHEFDGWFRSNADFDRQKQKSLLNCPICGSSAIEKLLMAPAIATSRQKEKTDQSIQQQSPRLKHSSMDENKLAKLREIVKKLRDNADYVGDKFAEEARSIHYGEKAERAIYGEASINEVVSLVDEGVDIMPLPTLPEDKN